MKQMIEKHGITLIALVITIIVLVVLAGISINLIFKEYGIIERAETASEETTKAVAKEKMNLKITEIQMVKYTEEQRMPTLQELADELCEDEEIQYVTLQSKTVASLEKITVGEATSIYTKIKEHPYEFEINSSLQLASIDGVKVETNNNTQVIISVQELKNLIQEEIQKANVTAVPSGTVISYITGTAAPEGYLKCDGTVYNISEYQTLADAIKTGLGKYNYYGGDGETTFAVPDLRGEFLRGTGTATRNTGSGAAVGVHQNPTQHINMYTGSDANVSIYGKSNSVQNADKFITTGNSSGGWYNRGGNTNTTTNQRYISRPTNTSVLYCIKY